MSSEDLRKESERRRTFAIISHPDAGKTTLTEKLLLHGGAIHLAGSVKARKAQKHAVSDWMEIEKQRGISVTSSVLQFHYQNYCINILDTPGHQDFSEDTYRTLMAADSAVMVIDVSKGVEEQTKKLFRVCKQRHIPIFTFINKLDRFGKNPFDLLEEIEQVLGINAYPMNWPIGIDGNYLGVYTRKTGTAELFPRGSQSGQKIENTVKGKLSDTIIAEAIGAEISSALSEDIELLDTAGNQFSFAEVAAGELTPVFFGSAMTNFGVRPFLEEYLALAPAPGEHQSTIGAIRPDDEAFSAFVFKIQANMNPAHRDRLAFIRICSGKFTKGMSVYHMQGGKTIKLSQPQQMMAQERTMVEEAYAGDIIGLFDPGILGIGDTLCLEKKKFQFEDFPLFPPELFARVYPKDSMKRKQFLKGIMQLTQEGAVQVFRQPDSAIEAFIVGVVGNLQFEVLEYRLKHEYSVDLVMERQPFTVAKWLSGEKTAKKELKGMDSCLFVLDRAERPVALFNNEWGFNWAEKQNPDTIFSNVPLTNQE